MKNSKIIALFLLISSLASGCSVLGIKTTEQATYKLIHKDGSFEIRDYPSMIVARVKNTGDIEKSQNESFRELFKYISGRNTSQQKISMTAPVLIKENTSEKISMTAPVLIKNNEMSFVLPKKYSLESAPKPKSDRIEIVELESTKRIVYTFSGTINTVSIKEGKNKLLEYVDRNNINIIKSSIICAGYNPPWTLPPLRRNEIMIDLDK